MDFTSYIWFLDFRLGNALWARIGKKHRINSYQIIHCPMSSGVSEVSERAN